MLAEDLTGLCIKAKKGMFINPDNEVKECSTVDPNCLECLDLTGLCLVCSKGYILNQTSKVCELPPPPPPPVVVEVIAPGEYTESEKKYNKSYSTSKSVMEAVSIAAMAVGSVNGVVLV